MSQKENQVLLRGMVERAARQFDLYAEQHAAKDTPDGDIKANTNRQLAYDMRAALKVVEFDARVEQSIERQTYYLVCGQIVFRATGEEDGAPAAILINTTVISPDGRFAVLQIARAQQALQAQFHRRMEGQTLDVLDCIIQGIMPLGQFTPEEFNAAPEGQVVQPQVARTEDELQDMLKAAGISIAPGGNA
ncbi:hypothetical protein [Roseococcus sp.]|uniref:hypothetical protein n=1 Tax=Roseococcus sp. TaxID=2109646 RepID=UPI003BAB0A09